jgi:hypothetical protein
MAAGVISLIGGTSDGLLSEVESSELFSVSV